LLVTGYWLLVTGYWLLVTGYWLLVTGCIKGDPRYNPISLKGTKKPYKNFRIKFLLPVAYCQLPI